MRARILWVWAAGAVAVASASACPATVEGQGPRIKFDHLVFDFGALYQEEVITYEYVLRNVGDAPLKITKVTSTCGCTAAMPPQKEVAPGESAAIKVTFRSGRMRDRITKHIHVESNDPVEGRTTLTLTGFIKREVEIVPSGIYLGNVKLGQVMEKEILIRPVEVADFRILEARTDHQAVQVEKPERLTDKQGGYRLKVRFGPLAQPTRVNAVIIVRTDLKHSRDLRIMVHARVGHKPMPNTASAG